MVEMVGAARIARLQAEMKARGIAVLVCLKPQNSFYLSGFNPIIASHPVVAVLTTEGAPTLLVHALRDDHARFSAWTSDIRLHGSWSTKKTMGPNWLLALRDILVERGVADGPIGIEDDYISMGRLAELEATFPQARLVGISDMIRLARLTKDPQEIADIRIACKLADIGVQAAIATLREGVSERAVSNAAIFAMQEAWARDYPGVEAADLGHPEGGVHYALWGYALFGERVLLNCDNPLPRRAQKGEIALIIILTSANCMKGENERSVAIGELPPERRRAYDAVLEVRARTTHLIRPGTPVRELFLAAKAEYARLGYAPNTPGRVGHGMGLGAHEDPSLEENSSFVLQPGMVISYEPNLRIAEWGGLQHSDTILITKTGNEFLTQTDNGYIQV